MFWYLATVANAKAASYAEKLLRGSLIAMTARLFREMLLVAQFVWQAAVLTGLPVSHYSDPAMTSRTEQQLRENG